MENSATRTNHAPPWVLAGSALVVLAIGVAGYLHVPPGTLVAIHFGPAGAANGWASPVMAFFTAPFICAGLLLFQSLLPAIKPSADDLERAIVSRVFAAIGIVLVAAQTYVLVRAV